MIKPFEEVYKCDSITINITNNCNLRCVYCFEHNKSVHRDNMSVQTAIDIVDKAYSTHPIDQSRFSNKFTINFFGGEPFLNWEAMKAVIDHCTEKEYDVTYGVTANLTILTDEILQYIDDHNIFLLVSIDGIKEIHDRNRCNSFDKVAVNIQRLIDKGLITYVEGRMTIMPEDVSHLFDSVMTVYNLGINNICPMVVTDVEWSQEALDIYREQYSKLFDFFLDSINDNDNKRNIAMKNINDIIVNVFSPEVTDGMLCPIFSNRWCAFDTNGDVYPCHQLPTSTPEYKKKNYIGNIYTGVDTDMIRNTQTKVKYYKEECDTCNARLLCKGGCPQENLRMNHREDEPSKAYCDTRRLMVEVVKEKQDQIMNATNIRDRKLNILKENLKIKKYIDLVYNETDLRDTLTSSARIMKVKEMINNLGEEKLLPTFKDYFEQRLTLIASIITTELKFKKKEIEYNENN